MTGCCACTHASYFFLLTKMVMLPERIVPRRTGRYVQVTSGDFSWFTHPPTYRVRDALQMTHRPLISVCGSVVVVCIIIIFIKQSDGWIR